MISLCTCTSWVQTLIKNYLSNLQILSVRSCRIGKPFPNRKTGQFLRHRYQREPLLPKAEKKEFLLKSFLYVICEIMGIKE